VTLMLRDEPGTVFSTGEAADFQLLARAPMSTNRQARDVAEELVRTGALPPVHADDRARTAPGSHCAAEVATLRAAATLPREPWRSGPAAPDPRAAGPPPHAGAGQVPQNVTWGPEPSGAGSA
jgi:hypothetical protein